MPPSRLILALIPDVERLLDRRQRRFGRIRDLLRIVSHFPCRLACYAGPARPESHRAAPRARDAQIPIGPGLPRPHVLLPSPILSIWRIGGNRTGNVLLIIVNNDLDTISPLGTRRTARLCHCAANNAAGLGPVRGLRPRFGRASAAVRLRRVTSYLPIAVKEGGKISRSGCGIYRTFAACRA